MSDLFTVGGELKSAVQAALAALEQAGVSARDADEFIREAVFEAWWDWDYGVLVADKAPTPAGEAD